MTFSHLQLLTPEQLFALLMTMGMKQRVIKFDSKCNSMLNFPVVTQLRGGGIVVSHVHTNTRKTKRMVVAFAVDRMSGLGVARVNAIRKLGSVFDQTLYGRYEFRTPEDETIRTAKTYVYMGFDKFVPKLHPCLYTFLMMTAVMHPDVVCEMFEDEPAARVRVVKHKRDTDHDP